MAMKLDLANVVDAETLVLGVRYKDSLAIYGNVARTRRFRNAEVAAIHTRRVKHLQSAVGLAAHDHVTLAVEGDPGGLFEQIGAGHHLVYDLSQARLQRSDIKAAGAHVGGVDRSVVEAQKTYLRILWLVQDAGFKEEDALHDGA